MWALGLLPNTLGRFSIDWKRGFKETGLAHVWKEKSFRSLSLWFPRIVLLDLLQIPYNISGEGQLDACLSYGISSPIPLPEETLFLFPRPCNTELA